MLASTEVAEHARRTAAAAQGTDEEEVNQGDKQDPGKDRNQVERPVAGVLCSEVEPFRIGRRLTTRIDPVNKVRVLGDANGDRRGELGNGPATLRTFVGTIGFELAINFVAGDRHAFDFTEVELFVKNAELDLLVFFRGAVDNDKQHGDNRENEDGQTTQPATKAHAVGIAGLAGRAGLGGAVALGIVLAGAATFGGAAGGGGLLAFFRHLESFNPPLHADRG